MALSETIEYVAILIDGPSEVVPYVIDGEEDFV
jgi:hypothetical protein